jgi:glucose-6-phosphate 1-dehydrogenase
VTSALTRLALLGATGDLAGRYLFPALAALVDAGRLPEPFTLVGAAREDLDDEGFRASSPTDSTSTRPTSPDRGASGCWSGCASARRPPRQPDPLRRLEQRAHSS